MRQGRRVHATPGRRTCLRIYHLVGGFPATRTKIEYEKEVEKPRRSVFDTFSMFRTIRSASIIYSNISSNEMTSLHRVLSPRESAAALSLSGPASARSRARPSGALDKNSCWLWRAFLLLTSSPAAIALVFFSRQQSATEVFFFTAPSVHIHPFLLSSNPAERRANLQLPRCPGKPQNAVRAKTTTAGPRPERQLPRNRRAVRRSPLRQDHSRTTMATRIGRYSTLVVYTYRSQEPYGTLNSDTFCASSCRRIEG